ncbi:MAG: hypothetical protein RJA36_1585 [Pseudomonadota bacterium]|jgi:hypothetical protein
MTTAQQIAAKLANNGQNFDGFDDLIDTAGARREYSQRVWSEEAGASVYKAGHLSGYISGDPIRHVFADGSAIVTAGDGWDIEGDEPFSWLNA